MISIETLVQEFKGKSAGPAKEHASKSLDEYMREEYIDEIRAIDEEGHKKLKLYLKADSPKKRSKRSTQPYQKNTRRTNA